MCHLPWQQEGMQSGQSKIPRKTPGRLSSHTNAPNEQLDNTKIWYAWGAFLKFLSDA